MGDEDLVVAVRLCDTTEAEQPDPLCLRQEDLEKWRHFESLLRGMYQNPPDAISVTYLDDENDWVQVGSDAELSEAVRTDGAASVSNVDVSSKQLLDLLAASKAGQSTIQGRLAYTSALPKSKASKQRTPVPMPRNLLMMEGAQSGANAVAIEIPSESSDFFQGVAVNKEEEIAAIKITEDVESGEKLNMKKEATTLSRSDFAKYMKKVS
ncbi:unnamed protein product, partial [Candidula unifasciata]